MPNFVWTAKDKLGMPVVREVTADTIEESKAKLLAQGCSDLELRDDEIMDAARSGFTEKTVVFGEEVPRPTAEQRFEHRGKPPMTFFRILRDSIVQDKGLYLIMIALIGFESYRGSKVIAVVLGIGTLSWPVLRVWLGLPGIYYAKLIRARDWHQWTDVLSLVEKSEKIRRTHVIKLPAVELGRSRAQALAGLGKLSDALRELQQWENQPGLPSWLYNAQLAGIYDIVKQHDRGLEYTRKAIEEKPTPALYLDLANRLLRYKKDTVGAREALANAEKSTISDIAKPFHHRCRGFLACLEGDSTLARSELEASLEIMERTKHQPFRDGHISVVKGYLCCVLARQGNIGAARKCLEESRKYLVATGEDELLRECDSAVKTAT